MAAYASYPRSSYPSVGGSYPTAGAYPTTTGAYPTAVGAYPTAASAYPTSSYSAGVTGSYPTAVGSYPTAGAYTSGVSYPSAAVADVSYAGCYPTAGYSGYAGAYPTVADDLSEEVKYVPIKVPVQRSRPVMTPVHTVERVVHVPQYIQVPQAPQIQYQEKLVEKAVKQRVYVCNGCGEDIDGEMIETRHGKFHRQCYIVCAGCGGWIQSNAFEAMGRMWHSGCFVCFKCNKSCAGSFIVVEGRAAHQACMQPKTQPRSGMAAKKVIKAKSFEEAVRYDSMGDGEPDGKYNNVTIECDDPRWAQRARERGYSAEATWECSDDRMAKHYGQSVVSTDGVVDGDV